MLWNSKLVVFDYVYSCLFKYGDKPGRELRINYTDTDSLHVYVKDAKFEKYAKVSNKYDLFLNDFPKEQQEKYLALDGDLTAGKMKFEYFIDYEVVIRPKLYYVETMKGEKFVKNKGVSIRQNDHLKSRAVFDGALEACKRLIEQGHIEKGSLCARAINTGFRKKYTGTSVKIVTQDVAKWAIDVLADKGIMLDAYTIVPFGYFDDNELGEADMKQFAERIKRNHFFGIKERTGVDCSDKFGISISDFANWFAGKLKDGMIPMNYGIAWEVDHIIPVNNYKSKSAPIEKIAHYTNLQPLMIKGKGGNRSLKDKCRPYVDGQNKME